MSDGWRPLQAPKRPKLSDPKIDRDGKPLGQSPFVRLARVHALSSAGDAMVTIALAGSLFFSIDPAAARWRVGMYLAVTIAPFALVSPLIGPAIDRARGGRRLMVIVIIAVKVIVALLMMGNLDSLLLFPLAFAFLLMQKSYSIAKAAIVPTTATTHDELVQRNSRLSTLGGISGFVGGGPALLAQVIAGPGASVFLAAIAFTAATVMATRLPRVAVAASPEGVAEREELRSGGIVLASRATGMLRGIVGFFTFLAAFAFRGGTDDLDLSKDGSALGAWVHESLLDVDVGASGTSPLLLGVLVGCSVIGGLVGSLLAPELRQRVAEEKMLLGAMLAITGAAVLGTLSGGLGGAMLVGFAVGMCASTGKLAFDSLVQRDAPDANYGRTFARFETRFQLLWVLGALIPVVLTLPPRLGFFGLACASGFAALSYYFGSRAIEDTEPGSPAQPLVVEAPILQPLVAASVAPRAISAEDPTLVAAPERDLGLDPTLAADRRDEPLDP